MLFVTCLPYIFLIWPLLEARAVIKNIFAGFLVQMKSLEFAFKINWPLELCLPCEVAASDPFLKVDFCTFVCTSFSATL